MNHSTFLFLFILGSLTLAHGQIFITNESLTDPKEKIAYHYATNLMRINSTDSLNSFSVIHSNNTNTAFIENMHFLYTPTKRGMDTFIIYQNGQKIQTEIINILPHPHHAIFLGTIRDSFATKPELLNNLKLIYTYPHSLLIANNHVSSFEAVIIKRSGREKVLHHLNKTYAVKQDKYGEEQFVYAGLERSKINYGNLFVNGQIRKIKRMNPGDILWIKTATIIGESCPRKIIPNIKITLTE